jgi:hypothetical protein
LEQRPLAPVLAEPGRPFELGDRLRPAAELGGESIPPTVSVSNLLDRSSYSLAPPPERVTDGNDAVSGYVVRDIENPFHSGLVLKVAGRQGGAAAEGACSQQGILHCGKD